jgi:hypothetical protein
MPASGWFTVPADAVAAAILLFAASAKLVAPAPLARALHRLTNSTLLSRPATARAIGGLEAAVALVLLIEPVRLAGSVLLCLLGSSFAALGAVGRVRKADEPCGCFGMTSRQPMGIRNIVLGLLLVLIGAINLATADRLTGDTRAAPVLLAAGLLCLTCAITGRGLLREPRALLEPSH